ncbi:hypothetical protein [Ochrobactrum sp. RH2CCR150]|uniref:hypothetical protein n=1 Tax=Ochrobactrum sp. RH2CCR150 TaxID=2587044 RepID=UPI0015FDC711|nr:succinylglutamate desuccinylase [Ochrobactrum sp. RH2CCR150]
MPLFNEASRIYGPEEVELMRRCFAQANEKLEQAESKFSASNLASSIVRLYQSGLRDETYIVDLAAGIASARFLMEETDFNFTNSNDPMEENIE